MSKLLQEKTQWHMLNRSGKDATLLAFIVFGYWGSRCLMDSYEEDVKRVNLRSTCYYTTDLKIMSVQCDLLENCQNSTNITTEISKLLLFV